ncbi:MAG TPA: VIT1/CCC1 transporter family protein [Dehalococcoidia bacterium]
MTTRDQRAAIRRYQANYQAELEGAYLYRALARAERDERRAAIFEELAKAEERHAERWMEKIRELGGRPRRGQVGMRARIIARLARWFGTKSVLPALNAMEMGDVEAFRAEPGAGDIARESLEHARTVASLAEPAGANHILHRERWHRGAAGGSLRAGVFGVNDGLVSNLSLVMGVSGASPGADVILLAGVAGLLAGAFSMAAGEYVSMRSQRELFERNLAMERDELRAVPEEEQEELSLIYQAKGVPKAEADRVAARIMEDPESALDTLAREELGLDPSELGSPWGAAASSFIMFALGAVIPVLPYIFGGAGLGAFLASAVLSGLALFGVGAALSIFTGRSALLSGGRMLAIGGAAAAVTYGVGTLLGVSAGG